MIVVNIHGSDYTGTPKKLQRNNILLNPGGKTIAAAESRAFFRIN
jgi:hypothetical protein